MTMRRAQALGFSHGEEVNRAESQGSAVAPAVRVAPDVGATRLVWVLIVNVTLGWGVCALTHRVRSDQEDETWPS